MTCLLSHATNGHLDASSEPSISAAIIGEQERRLPSCSLVEQLSGESTRSEGGASASHSYTDTAVATDSADPKPHAPSVCTGLLRQANPGREPGFHVKR